MTIARDTHSAGSGQHDIADTTDTMAMAAVGVLGIDANNDILFFTAGASANVEPQTSTNAICMANDSSDHTPLPQCSMASRGVWWHIGMAITNARTVSSMAKMNGSGRYF